MKKYLSVVFIMFVFLVTIIKTVSVSAFMPLSGKIIIIDPGHGGKDPGTSYGDVFEKDLNLNIAFYLREELAKYGASIIMTREGDYDLSSANSMWRKKSDFDNRIKLINNSNASLYLSIHLNYLNDAQYYGAQVFYNKDNIELARIVQKTLNNKLEGEREIKQIPTNTYMYNKLNIDGILIECGFLSNYKERELLKTNAYQQKIASTIAEAISKYY